MYPYPTQNYHVPQFPSFQTVNPTIPEMQYVSSAESADAFNLPPNKTAVLFNQNVDEFYIISSDASGTRTRTDFTFKAKAKDRKSEYVTRGEFDELKEMISSKPIRKATKETTDE